MAIRIFTDSASDILPDDYDNVTVLPLTITFGDTVYRDGVDLSHEEFYNLLIETDELPVTSQVNPFTFEEAFRDAIEAGDDVVAITISSKLSATYESALIAAASFPDRVHVVDSLQAAIGERVLVLRALELTNTAMSAADIATALELERNQVRIVALLDTLEYLKRGGRISGAAALAGGILSIKPVISVIDGEVVMLGKARGSKNGNNLLIQEIAKTNGIDFSRPYFLGYTGLSDGLLQKYIKDSEALWKGETEHLPICNIGATIGTHVGPGAIAVAFFAHQPE